jgi:hypothetical protein
MTADLAFLLGPLYSGALAPAHLADLRKSGLTDETIRAQMLRSVPPGMIDRLLGFPTPTVVSAYLIPFASSRGGWLDHVRLKVFPTVTTKKGTIKYLQRPHSGVRIFFPVATLPAVLHAADPLYVCEGEKKSLAVAQLGLPTIGICGIEGWHLARSTDLHPDLDDVGLTGRIVYVIPDGDWKTNPAVHLAVRRLGTAIARRGAEPRLLILPDGVKGIDDYLVANPS